jgi:rifampicin phosphotransferase
MTETATLASSIPFDAPGPGRWELEATHTGHRPVSVLLQPIHRSMMTDGSALICERYGLPLERLRMEHVNGCAYLRAVPLREGARPRPVPPRPILKLVVRLHPGLRRRNKIAAQAWRDKRWRTELDEWFTRDRAEIIAANRALQAVDPAGLDDAALARHLDDVVAHLTRTFNHHGSTHGADVIPMGDYFAHCQRWGIPGPQAADLLSGSSPASTEAAAMLAPLAAAVAASGRTPASLEGLRRLGPEAAAALDAWIADYSWRLITSVDLDVPTLAERPGLLLSTILAAIDHRRDPATADPAPVRALVPPGDRPLFDELLAEARYGMRHRDDNSGICASWPGGLVRRTLLEIGRRLADQGRLRAAEHAVEMSPGELRTSLLHRTGPTADEIAERAGQRNAIEAAGPPAFLGAPEPAPSADVFPAPLARAATAMLAMVTAMAREPITGPLRGTGIGTAAYRATARVVAASDAGLDRLGPGDILVTPFTTPAYNTVAPLLGGLITEEGGVMSHAAFLARECGIPAVLGVAHATRLISDGTTITITPAAGQVETSPEVPNR